MYLLRGTYREIRIATQDMGSTLTMLGWTGEIVLWRWLGIAVVALSLVACERSSGSPEPYHHQVSAITLSGQDSYQVQRYFVGRIEARQQAELGFEVAGTVAEVLVEEGDKVSAGQALARLDSSLLAADIRALEAGAQEIRARLQLVELNIKRQQTLRKQGLAVEQQLDQLQTERAALKANLQQQQAQLDAATTQLSKHRIAAPYSGEISQRNVDTGSAVTPGKVVFQLLESSWPEMRVGVPAHLLAGKAVGDSERVIINHRDYRATIKAIVNSVDAVTNTATLRLAIAKDPAVAHGEVAYLSLPEEIATVGFWIPAEALTAGVRGMWNVYVLSPAGGDLSVIEARSVELLYMADERAFVRGAIVAGEQIVAAGTHRVAPGLAVRLRPSLAMAPSSALVSKLIEPVD